MQCGSGCNLIGYYAVDKGQYLTGRLHEFNYRFGQGVVSSPDEKMMFIDQTLMDLSDISSFKYVLFDLERQTESVFPIDKLLDFLWWAEDNNSFLFHVQPFVDDPEYANGTYSLMSYSLESSKPSLLLPDAVHIAATRDRDKYLAVTLDGTLHDLSGLNIAMFDENHKRISDELFYSGQMVFSDAYNGFVRPGVWSDDGSKAIFINERGEFWLLSEQGEAMQLSEGNEIEEWPYGIRIVWAPEGKQAVIMYNDQIWLVAIPEK